MTLIVGIDYGREIYVRADSRVSYPGPQAPPPKDRLRKLVAIRFADRRAVLGFSGTIAEIKRILEYISVKARHFRTSGSLRDDLKTWMEEFISSKPKTERHSLSFMLCDFDPSDSSHIHVYKLTTDGEVLLEPDKIFEVPGFARLATIGEGSKFEHQIRKAALETFGNPKDYVDYDAFSRVRALGIDLTLAWWFEDRPSGTVGGPSTIFRIRPDGVIGPEFTLPPEDDSPDIQVTEDGKKTVLYSPSTNKEFTLFSIFAYTDADFSARQDACASLCVSTE